MDPNGARDLENKVVQGLVNLIVILINILIWWKWGLEPVIVIGLTHVVLALRGIQVAIMAHAVVLLRKGS